MRLEQILDAQVDRAIRYEVLRGTLEQNARRMNIGAEDLRFTRALLTTARLSQTLVGLKEEMNLQAETEI